MNVAHEFLPAMIAAPGEWRMINLASAAGFTPNPRMAVYPASIASLACTTRWTNSPAGPSPRPSYRHPERKSQSARQPLRMSMGNGRSALLTGVTIRPRRYGLGTNESAWRLVKPPGVTVMDSDPVPPRNWGRLASTTWCSPSNSTVT